MMVRESVMKGVLKQRTRNLLVDAMKKREESYHDKCYSSIFSNFLE